MISKLSMEELDEKDVQTLPIKGMLNRRRGRVNEGVYNLSTLRVEVLPSITFTSKDLRGLHLPHNDALMISAIIKSCKTMLHDSDEDKSHSDTKHQIKTIDRQCRDR